MTPFYAFLHFFNLFWWIASARIASPFLTFLDFSVTVFISGSHIAKVFKNITLETSVPQSVKALVLLQLDFTGLLLLQARVLAFLVTVM